MKNKQIQSMPITVRVEPPASPIIPGVGEVSHIAVEYFLAVMKELYPTPPSPSPTYSPAMVRGYAGVLRLAQLEAAGIRYASTGLPNVRQAFTAVTVACTIAQPDHRDRAIEGFVNEVIDKTSDYFSLEGRSLLGADVLVAVEDDDVDLDILAQFLVDTRPKGGSNGS